MALLRLKGTKTSVYRLKKVFKKKGIRYKSVRLKHRWRKEHDAKNKEKDERTFVKFREGVRNAMERGRALVWVDESIYNQRLCQRFAWSRKGDNMTPTTMLHDEPSFAVVVAITAPQGLLHFRIRPKSFKTDDFLQFVKELRNELGGGQFDLVLDNCTIHKTKKLKDYCKEHKVGLIYQVPYHPEQQCCENFFAWSKEFFRRRILEQRLGKETEIL